MHANHILENIVVAYTNNSFSLTFWKMWSLTCIQRLICSPPFGS